MRISRRFCRRFLPASFVASTAVLAMWVGTASRSHAIAAATACNTFEPSWTAHERSVWQRVCNRTRVVLPNAANTIGAGFLKTILLSEPYRSAVHSRIEIENPHFTGPVNLSDANITVSLLLDRAHFDGPVSFDRSDMKGLSMARAEFADMARFEGAKIAGSIDLQGANTKCINLAGTDVADAIFLNGLIAKDGGRSCLAASKHGDIALIDTRVGLDLDAVRARTGALDASRANVHGAVTLSGGVFRHVNFGAAHIGGMLTLTSVTADGIDLSDIDAVAVAMGRDSGPGESYVGRVPRYGAVSLLRAHVKSDVSMQSGTAGAVDASFAEIGGKVIFVDSALGTVNLTGARIAGLCGFYASTTGDIDATSSDIGGALAFFANRQTDRPSFGTINASGARLGALALLKATTGSVAARGASISRNVKIEDASMEAMDLTSTRVEGNLSLIAHKGPLFRGRGGLVLRNAAVRAFDDRAEGCMSSGAGCPDPWPRGCNSADDMHCSQLDLNGFTYGSFEFAGRRDRRDDRTAEWGKTWLGHASFSPQPYRQLASVFQSAGRPEDAVEIEVAGKDRELQNASFGGKAFLLFDRLLVGYGYHPEYAAVWAALLVVTGLLVVLRSGQQAQLTKLRRDGEPMTVSALVYSFDALIPLVTLRKTDADTEFRGWPGYYFFGQRIAGYVLGAFLVAGISGLTK